MCILFIHGDKLKYSPFKITPFPLMVFGFWQKTTALDVTEESLKVPFLGNCCLITKAITAPMGQCQRD